MTANPMVELSYGDGAEDLTVDDDDEDTLHKWIQMSESGVKEGR